MLSVRDITIKHGPATVLSNISFDLEHGQTVVILGPNGAGKTTLIKALNRTLKATVGEVVLKGRPIHSYSRREVATHMAVVAQENETKFPVSVIEFVLSGRFAHGSYFGWESAIDVAAAERALTECDLLAMKTRPMNELSGGERQRAVFARAIATEAEILLLDEPTANLDLAHQSMLFRLVRGKTKANSCSAVVVTHDLNLAAEFADKILLLRDGRMLAAGIPSDVLTETNLREAFGVDTLLDQNPVSRNVRITAIY